MKNSLISSLIFLSLLASVLFFNNKLINVCDKVNDYSNKIESSLSKEDWKESYEESLKLSNLLEESLLIFQKVTGDLFRIISLQCYTF